VGTRQEAGSWLDLETSLLDQRHIASALSVLGEALREGGVACPASSMSVAGRPYIIKVFVRFSRHQNIPGPDHRMCEEPWTGRRKVSRQWKLEIRQGNLQYITDHRHERFGRRNGRLVALHGRDVSRGYLAQMAAPRGRDPAKKASELDKSMLVTPQLSFAKEPGFMGKTVFP